MVNVANEVAQLVLKVYTSLPANGKPLLRSNNVREWTVLAGIVIKSLETNKLETVALATGVKASPESVITQSNGKVLHDCHAEVLAIRAFNVYVLEKGTSHIGEIYMYISHPPCGDASMSALNGGEDWEVESVEEIPLLIRGRAHYNQTGRIRTKPGRQDSRLTMSKSCSDKLCLRQSRGLLLTPLKFMYANTNTDASFQTSEPARNLFLTAIVCPVILPDFDRAFSRWNPSHRFQYMKTDVEFVDGNSTNAVPSPCSLVWTLGSKEVIANGVKQGSKGVPSRLSRRCIAEKVCANLPKEKRPSTYSEMKTNTIWPHGWIRTSLDDFTISAE